MFKSTLNIVELLFEAFSTGLRDLEDIYPRSDRNILERVASSNLNARGSTKFHEEKHVPPVFNSSATWPGRNLSVGRRAHLRNVSSSVPLAMAEIVFAPATVKRRLADNLRAPPRLKRQLSDSFYQLTVVYTRRYNTPWHSPPLCAFDSLLQFLSPVRPSDTTSRATTGRFMKRPGIGHGDISRNPAASIVC